MPAQCYALVYSNSFISVLALENVASAHLSADIRQPLLIAAAIVASVVLVILCLFGTAPGRTPRPWRRYATASVAVACAVAAFATNRASPVADGAGGLQPGQSPVTALLLTGWQKRSEEHTSELQSLMRISYAVFCLKKKHRHQRVNRRPSTRIQ